MAPVLSSMTGTGFTYASVVLLASTISSGCHVMFRSRDLPPPLVPGRPGGFHSPEFPVLRFSARCVGVPSWLRSFRPSQKARTVPFLVQTTDGRSEEHTSALQ